MLKSLLLALAVPASCGLLLGADSLPATYKSAADLMAVLAKNTKPNAELTSAPVANEPHYRINVVRRDKPGFALAHATGPAKGSEVHYIIDGAATVVTGGTIIRKAGGPPSSAVIEGGETRRVTKGDVIVVPAGTPHWYKEVEGSVTYLEVRFDVDLSK
jgi:mannose-6-phosphate isomerase-like protein (cupin superfamily)